jgi:SAM-dependent methyltransferase
MTVSTSDKTAGRKTEQAHWDAAWESAVRLRLPSRLNVSVRNITRLLARHVRPGHRYIEIGCAPGKLLAWVASVLRAQASGLDYSAAGIAQCRRLFAALNLGIELHQADFFDHPLPLESFDVVASFGFIEHFEDPAQAVAQHVRLVRPGGTALIAVPNYGGLYGKLQQWCDPANLALHNLQIMTPSALRALVPESVGRAQGRAFGAIDPWLVSLDRRLPAPLAKAVSLGVNALGLAQPGTITACAPLLVLEVKKRP